MSDFHKDIFTGILFVLGMLSFMSGEFIFSSLTFAAASISSNTKLNRSRIQANDGLCD